MYTIIGQSNRQLEDNISSYSMKTSFDKVVKRNSSHLNLQQFRNEEGSSSRRSSQTSHLLNMSLGSEMIMEAQSQFKQEEDSESNFADLIKQVVKRKSSEVNLDEKAK